MLNFSDTQETIADLLDPTRPVVADLTHIRDKFGLTNIAYFGLPSFGSLDKPPRLEVTYDDAWVKHYKDSDYSKLDPVLEHGLSATSCFDWSHLKNGSPDTRKFFGEASEFDVGESGLTIPILGQGHPIALVSFTSVEKSTDWARFVAEHKSALHMIGVAIHEHVWMKHVTVCPSKLSEREKECLGWAAVGKTAYETSIIVGISERTVRHHLETSRKKLDASNVTHAVVKAISDNLLIKSRVTVTGTVMSTS